MPNRWWASISSSPLFISVAESIVILPPIAHVGCASACSTVTWLSSLAVRPRNGPPEAVRITRSTVPARSEEISWWIAECSESTGMIAAPVACASCVTSSPPTTSDSLLASARSIPSPSVATVGTRPAEPTIPLSTSSQSPSVISADQPLGTRQHLAVGPGLAGARGRVRIRQRDPLHPVLARLHEQLLPGAGGAQRDDLEVRAGPRDDVEGLDADRARGAEDGQAARHSAIVGRG